MSEARREDLRRWALKMADELYEQTRDFPVGPPAGAAEVDRARKRVIIRDAIALLRVYDRRFLASLLERFLREL